MGNGEWNDSGNGKLKWKKRKWEIKTIKNSKLKINLKFPFRFRGMRITHNFYGL